MIGNESRDNMSQAAVQPRSTIIRVVAASMAGTTVEWYDFFLYGVAAALVFPKVFFPGSDPAVGVLLALGTFAIGFIARPIGGLVFGHYGDILGRKKLLGDQPADDGVGNVPDRRCCPATPRSGWRRRSS